MWMRAEGRTLLSAFSFGTPRLPAHIGVLCEKMLARKDFSVMNGLRLPLFK